MERKPFGNSRHCLRQRIAHSIVYFYELKDGKAAGKEGKPEDLPGQ
jgi:hypothetical protein